MSERSNCELLSELRIVCVCGRELFATERKKTIFENFVIKMRDDTVWPIRHREFTRRCFMELRASESVSIESSTGLSDKHVSEVVPPW